MTHFYESMLRPGKYKVTWQPYNASISSQPLTITVLAERQAIILTDMGKITLRFYYEQAPQHVQNFIDCVKSRNLPNGDVLIGHRSAQASHLGNISYMQKRRIDFDPVREEIQPF
jgi:hypothetical protein